jgi:hypothetical protein
VRRFNLARATASTAAVRTETLMVVIAIETNAAVIISMLFLALPNCYRGSSPGV